MRRPIVPLLSNVAFRRVERNPALVSCNIFADTSCDTPLTEGHISIFRTDGPGLSPNEPMAIVQADVQVEVTSIPDGRYVINNRAAKIYWGADDNPINKVYFFSRTTEEAKENPIFQVNDHSPIILVLRRITLFQSGTSHKMLMGIFL